MANSRALAPTAELASDLGNRRLSIIDLTGAHQPPGNADGAVQIVFESLREEL
jgi:asparagine synthetase B (glutamine-hydrolysing)